MARSDHSHPSDEGRRRTSGTGGLSLSTGRLEGRPRSAAEARGTRHNPLRDTSDDRGSRNSGDRPHRASGDDRASDRSGRSHREQASRSARRHSGAGASSLKEALSPFAPQLHTIGSHGGRHSHGGHHGPAFDLRRIGMGAGAVALGAVLVMAVAHVGPFAPNAEHADYSKHVGALGIQGITNNAMYVGQNVATQISLARPVEPDLEKLPPHQATREDINGLSDQKAPYAFAFDASQGDGNDAAGAPVLSDRSLVSLSNALSYYDANGYEASYLFMDLGTGRGIAGNLDVPIYGASSFKGPFCAYVVNKELPNDIERARDARLRQIENIIFWSDNASYGQLRRDFGNDGMREWLAEAGVDEALVDDTYFPTYTARQSALMWLKIYDYLEHAGTSAASWLSDVFEGTEVSFLRNGALGTTSEGHTDYLPAEGSGTEEGVEEGEVDAGEEVASKNPAESGEEVVTVSDGKDETGEEVVTVSDGKDEGSEVKVEVASDGGETGGDDLTVASIGTNIVVRNKAGWIDGEEDDAVCDSGIVTINGRDYLMVIMTNAPDSRAGEQAFAHLARTLFEIRSDLV